MNILKKFCILLPIFSLFLSSCAKIKNIKIGIFQIVDHEALNLARQGFIDELKSLGYDESNVKFNFKIAGGDFSNCLQIANKFVSDKCDLILAISTPCAEAAANATKEIPILVTAITDPESAKLVKSNEKPDTNLTGTSDLAPIEQQINLIKELNPSVRKIGILYSLIDESPIYQAECARRIIDNLGLVAKLVSISDTNEVEQATRQLARYVDSLYVPIDKITASSMPLISNIFLNENKFVVCSESTLVDKGAIGTYGVDYYELGKLTAHQGADILQKKSKPQEMPIEYLKESSLILNEDIMKKLNLKLPKN